jgi:hypothetical protein
MFIQQSIRWALRHAAPTLGVATFVLCLYFRAEIANFFGPEGWSISGFYSSVLNLGAVKTGFILGIYTYVVSKDTGFIGAIKGSSAYKEMITYLRRIFYTVFVMTFGSVPLAVVLPVPSEDVTWETFAFSFWAAFFVYTSFCFLRILRAFSAIERVRR